MSNRIAIIGSGPAGLMAATVLAEAGVKVVVYEKKSGPAKKLLVAGSSGLNITYDAPLEKFSEYYRGPKERFDLILEKFPPTSWIQFIESLGVKTFKGTSKRYFVEGMKAASLLKAWIERLEKSGVVFYFAQECLNFRVKSNSEVELEFENNRLESFSAACFALGGGSWEKNENPLRWPKMFLDKGLKFVPFESSNVGYKVNWPKAFLKECDGKPIKNVTLKTKLGSKRGDVMITSYGIEGTPVYYVGNVGAAQLDLRPDLSSEQILEKLKKSKENLSPIRRAKKLLSLDEVTQSLLFHCLSQADKSDLNILVERIKNFNLEFLAKQPLQEAISSTGGVSWNEVDSNLMLKKQRGVFVCGEMLDWDAPTGGFLIQGCVSQGRYAAERILDYLASDYQ